MFWIWSHKYTVDTLPRLIQKKYRKSYNVALCDENSSVNIIIIMHAIHIGKNLLIYKKSSQ